MTWAVPEAGLVIRYSYLWEREAREGREEGVKDRPCAIVLTVHRNDGAHLVRVLPVTHTRPDDPDEGIEIPLATKRRLGLDSERSWIVLTEANDFIWPGPDLRPAINGEPASAAYGVLPPSFFRALRQRLLARWRDTQARSVKRTQ